MFLYVLMSCLCSFFHGLRHSVVDQAEIKSRIENAWQRENVQHCRDKPIQYLRFGQKKRVAIAGALVIDSDNLLLHEQPIKYY